MDTRGCLQTRCLGTRRYLDGHAMSGHMERSGDIEMSWHSNLFEQTEMFGGIEMLGRSEMSEQAEMSGDMEMSGRSEMSEQAEMFRDV